MTVRHVTGYKYEGLVTASYNEARMTPTNVDGQLVLSSRLDVSPTPWTFRYRDYWGCQVTAFEVHEPHEPHQELTLEAVSALQVARRPPSPPGSRGRRCGRPRCRTGTVSSWR
jgi:transglutaminase-like putative cysteine protease